MKRRILFLTLYNESGASSRVAIYQLLPFFEEAGYEVTVLPFLREDAYRFLARLAEAKRPWDLLGFFLTIAVALPRRVIDVVRAWKYDVVVVQKDVLPLGLSRLLALGQKRIVFTFDDPIWLGHKASGQRVPVVGSLITWYRKRCLQGILQCSQLCIVDSPPIREFAARYCGRSFVLDTSIDLAPYEVTPASGERFGLVWIGSPSTSYLIGGLLPAIERLALLKPIRLFNVGSHPISGAGFPVENYPWSTDNELRALGQSQIGLMPCDDGLFNQYRFSRKWLHYGAARVPTLASDNGLNPLVVSPDRNGLLYRAGDEGDFVRQAKRLLEDEPLRKRLGESARRYLEARCDLPIVGKHFVELVDSLFSEGARPEAPTHTEEAREALGR